MYLFHRGCISPATFLHRFAGLYVTQNLKIFSQSCLVSLPMRYHLIRDKVRGVQGCKLHLWFWVITSLYLRNMKHQFYLLSLVSKSKTFWNESFGHFKNTPLYLYPPVKFVQLVKLLDVYPSKDEVDTRYCKYLSNFSFLIIRNNWEV